GRRPVDAHLVLERAATDLVALAGVALAVHSDLRYREQRDALAARGCIRQARKHQVDDVVGEVVLAGGNEDLGAGDRVAAVGPGFGPGADQAEVGTALRFGQAHRAGPAALDQWHQERLALPLLAMLQQRRYRAVGQQREVAPGEVGGVDHLLEGDIDQVRQPLAAVFRGRRKPGPAALDELEIGVAEAGRRGDLAGFR